MADLIFIAITVGFFGLCVGFVRACDRLISSSSEEPLPGTEPAGRLEEAAL
jgi:hypothetical protein